MRGVVNKRNYSFQVSQQPTVNRFAFCKSHSTVWCFAVSAFRGPYSIETKRRDYPRHPNAARKLLAGRTSSGRVSTRSRTAVPTRWPLTRHAARISRAVLLQGNCPEPRDFVAKRRYLPGHHVLPVQSHPV